MVPQENNHTNAEGETFYVTTGLLSSISQQAWGRMAVLDLNRLKGHITKCISSSWVRFRF